MKKLLYICDLHDRVVLSLELHYVNSYIHELWRIYFYFYISVSSFIAQGRL